MVTPQSAIAPAEIRGTGPAGSASFEVTPALTKFPIKTYGMVAGPLLPGTVRPEDVWGKEYAVTVPAGTKAVEFTVRSDNPQAGLLYFMLALGLGEKHFPAVLGASIVALIALVLASVFRKDDSQDQ